jgi:hypothetical protein
LKKSLQGIETKRRDESMKISYCSVVGELARHDNIWQINAAGDCVIVRCEDRKEAAAVAALFDGRSKGNKAYIPIIKGIGHQEEVEEVQLGQQARLF